MQLTSDFTVYPDEDLNLELVVTVSYRYTPGDPPENVKIVEVVTGSPALGWSALKREVVAGLEPWLIKEAEEALTSEVMAEAQAARLEWVADEEAQAGIDAWKERRASGESK